jgi:hypothetical protein
MLTSTITNTRAAHTNWTLPGGVEIVGNDLEAVHESIRAPTGLGVDSQHNIFITYARNNEPQNITLAKATGFSTEEHWPSQEWQNCVTGQNLSTCFVNVQNAVLDSFGQLWILDSGVPYGRYVTYRLSFMCS